MTAKKFCRGPLVWLITVCMFGMVFGLLSLLVWEIGVEILLVVVPAVSITFGILIQRSWGGGGILGGVLGGAAGASMSVSCVQLFRNVYLVPPEFIVFCYACGGAVVGWLCGVIVRACEKQIRTMRTINTRATWHIRSNPVQLYSRPLISVLLRLAGVAFTASAILVIVLVTGELLSFDIRPHIRPLLNLRGHTGPVRSIAFSPDGKVVASAGKDGWICLWDTKTGEQRAKFGGTDEVWSVVFSRDGRLLASGGADKVVKLWDSTTGCELANLQGHSQLIRCLAFSSDGKKLASGAGEYFTQPGELILWNVEGKTQWKSKLFDQWIMSLAFSWDGSKLAVGIHGSAVLEVLDSETLTVAASLKHGHSIETLAFSDDGQMLATGGVPLVPPDPGPTETMKSQGAITLWDVEAWSKRSVLPAERQSIRSLAFAPDGILLASAGYGNSVWLWNVHYNTRALLAKGPRRKVACLSTSSKGQLAAGDGNGVISIWDLQR